MLCPEWKTEDGFEMQFGTNHLGNNLYHNDFVYKFNAYLRSLLVDPIPDSSAEEVSSSPSSDVGIISSYDG